MGGKNERNKYSGGVHTLESLRKQERMNEWKIYQQKSSETQHNSPGQPGHLPASQHDPAQSLRHAQKHATTLVVILKAEENLNVQVSDIFKGE